MQDRASAGRSNRAKLIGSIVLGGSIWVLGLLYLFSGRSNESSTPVPSWQQLLEMAVTEIDGGADLPLDYQRALLIAVGRCDAAIELLIQQHENGGFQKSDGINVVKQLVRFHREEKLQHPGLVSLLQPEDFARGRIQGLICRSDLDQAEAELKAVRNDNPQLLSIFFSDQLRIVKLRIANKQAEALANSLRLAVDYTAAEHGRRQPLSSWLHQLERCAELTQHHAAELIPQLLENADAANEDLQSDVAGSLVMARNHSLLAAIFFYCKKPDLANEQLAIAADFVDRTSLEPGRAGDIRSSESGVRLTSALDLLSVTGRIAALLANIGRIEDARKQIEKTKTQLRGNYENSNPGSDNNIIWQLLNYGAFVSAEELISMRSPADSRLLWQIRFCHALARHNQRDGAIARLERIIPKVSLEAEPHLRLQQRSEVIELLNTLGEKELCSKVVQEVLAEYEDHQTPKDLQLVFELLVWINDYENAWKLFRECDLDASDAKNLAKLGISLHDHQLASSGK